MAQIFQIFSVYRVFLFFFLNGSTVLGDHLSLYLTAQKIKKMFLEAFLKLLSFFFNLVLEDPISIVHVDRIFRYQTYPKIRKSYKRAIYTFFSFLTLLDMMNNDPLIMLKSFWNPPYPFYASNPVKI